LKELRKLLQEHFANKNLENPIEWMVEQQYLPDYFLGIPDKLEAIANELSSNGAGTGYYRVEVPILWYKEHDEIAESSSD
jgi:hypothetical protein